MIKYITIAVALKLFSSCSLTRNLYRYLGNTFGKKKRLKSKMPDYYITRVNRMLRLNQKYNLVKNGHNIIEIGTGWFHWEAITLKLFFDIKATLFDVWDNRQLEVLKTYLSQLRDSLSNMEIDRERIISAKQMINTILSMQSFNELYQLLEFTYFIEPTGNLNSFRDQSFDIILSAGVLEHIRKTELTEIAKEFHRLLKPGGYSVHSINLTDHLYLYDKNVSQKNYLRFSDKIWKALFENEVQYFNRIQRPEWLDLFRKSGFALIDEESDYIDIDRLHTDKKYENITHEDLGCILLNIVHRKMECY